MHTTEWAFKNPFQHHIRIVQSYKENDKKMIAEILKRLDSIDALMVILIEKVSQKPVYTVEETAEILNISVGYFYQLMSKGQISYSKPGGKVAYFTIEDILEYATQNHVKARAQIYQEAEEYLANSETPNILQQ